MLFEESQPTYPRFVKYEYNRHGNDYVVGDIHGCLTVLKQRLQEISFDTNKDRLFSVGDLTDRGPESHFILELRDEPWFIPIRGNHEQMLIDYYTNPHIKENHGNLKPSHGQAWFLGCSEMRQQAFIEWFKSMPHVIEVGTVDGGRVGIVHGEVPYEYDWKQITSDEVLNDAYVQNALVWSRTRINRGLPYVIEGVDQIICGHNVVDGVTELGNVMYIDTGCVYKEIGEYPSGKLTVVKIVTSSCIEIV